MTDRELTALLERAADDHDRPLRTDLDDLLLRARREDSRGRRRLGALATLAAAALVAGVVLVPRVVEHAGPAPATPRPSATPSPALTARTIVDRCRPQLAKFAAYPMYDQHPETAPWRLLHPGRTYRAGDLVALRDGGDGPGSQRHPYVGRGNPVLCRIPAPTKAGVPVGFDALTVRAGSDRLLREVCSENASQLDDRGLVPDLREARLLATSYAGNVAAALLKASNGKTYGCAVSPPTWDAGIDEVEPVSGSMFFEAYGTTGAGNKSIVGGGPASYALFAGRVPARARSLQLSWEGGPTRSFPVTDGSFAAVFRWATDRGTTPITWRVLDADRKVLSSGTSG